MSHRGCLALSVVLACAVPALAAAADEHSTATARVGEVHTLAIAPGNETAIASLHRDGWLQANGTVLKASEFPELFHTIGRTWTASRVKGDLFAVPDLHDQLQRPSSSDNPFGVLSPGDLVRGGNQLHSQTQRAPLSYWIFVGRDLSGAHLDAAGR